MFGHVIVNIMLHHIVTQNTFFYIVYFVSIYIRLIFFTHIYLVILMNIHFDFSSGIPVINQQPAPLNFVKIIAELI